MPPGAPRCSNTKACYGADELPLVVLRSMRNPHYRGWQLSLCGADLLAASRAGSAIAPGPSGKQLNTTACWWYQANKLISDVMLRRT